MLLCDGMWQRVYLIFGVVKALFGLLFFVAYSPMFVNNTVNAFYHSFIPFIYLYFIISLAPNMNSVEFEMLAMLYNKF